MRRSSPRWTPLERRVRASARVALYGSLAVLGLLLVLGVRFLSTIQIKAESLEWAGVDFAALPEVQLLQRYLAIDNSQPDADELAGARFLASVLEEAGIPATLEVLGERHANVWAILEGESPEALVLHSHIDTDPVPHPERWTHPPFGAEIELPYLYGRGAYDMKGVAMAQLSAFLELAASDRPLRRSVIFLATGSEEVGSDFGTRWILARHPDLARRFWAFLTEGGVVETRTVRNVKYWGIEFAQKRYVDVMVCGGSRERLEALREDLLAERRESFQVRVSPEVAAFMESYASSRDREDYRRLLANPGELRHDGPAWEELPEYLKAFFRDEAAPFLVEEAGPDEFRMLVKLHLLPGSDLEEARHRLLPEWMVHGLTLAVYDEGGADHGSPLDHPAYRAMEEHLRAARPGEPVGPLFLPMTATDSRFARAAGIPAYGFSPFLLFSLDTYRIGKEDERIRLPAYVEGVEIYRRLVRHLVQ